MFNIKMNVVIPQYKIKSLKIENRKKEMDHFNHFMVDLVQETHSLWVHDLKL